MKIRRPSSRDAAHCRERDSLQPGESLAAAGVAEPDRQLVVDGLQQRLVKTGGRLVKHARYYWLLLTESHLTRRLFGAMAEGDCQPNPPRSSSGKVKAGELKLMGFGHRIYKNYDPRARIIKWAADKVSRSPAAIRSWTSRYLPNVTYVG